MTPNQYRKTIDHLGLSQGQAARLLGVSPRTSRSYALGEYEIPRSVRNFLTFVLATRRSGDQALAIVEADRD